MCIAQINNPPPHNPVVEMLHFSSSVTGLVGLSAWLPLVERNMHMSCVSSFAGNVRGAVQLERAAERRAVYCIPILNMHSWLLFCMLHISNRFLWFHWGFIYNVFIFPRLWQTALHCSSKSLSLASIALDLQINLIRHNKMQLGMCPTEGSDA